jgi:peptidyl serine alpha-galactosyltransferase
MYAYSMASAHESLPHLQVDHYMVSNVEAGGEGWPWVDALPEVCLPPNSDNVYYPGQNIPTVAHFCQTYRIGEYMFTKRRVPHNIFDCDHPLFVEVPADIVKNDFFFKNSEVIG